MSYLTDKFPNYRILPSLDVKTNQFPRKLNGTLEDADIYIKCAKGIKVFHYGKGILDIYFPSKKTGLSTLRKVYAKHINPKNAKIQDMEVTMKLKTGEERQATKECVTIYNEKTFNKDISSSDMILYTEESDSEFLIRIKAKDFELFSPYINPSEYGARISPFSSKNQPKIAYNIPDEDLYTYNQIKANLPDNKLLSLGKMTSDFLKTLENKKMSYGDIKADMIQKCLKGKDYIHSIGKWNEYIDYLNENLDKL